MEVSKLKKMTTNQKIFFISLFIILLSISMIGTASIFAEPTLETTLADRMYGTYIPNFFYDDADADVQNWSVEGVLKHTNIIVGYGYWNDANGDGLTNLMDVYSQDNYQFNFLTNDITMPILKTSSDAEYYMVKLSALDQIDAVVVTVEMANNNDNAEVKSANDYYFDKDTNILYLGPNLVHAIQNGRELRLQTVSVAANIETFTKEFAIVTGFADNSTNNPLKNRVPFGVFKRGVKDWLISGLSINLIQPEHLAYVSKENLKVYVNESETENFVYDETTGILSFPDSSPYDIHNIMVYIEKLNDVSFSDVTLQYSQYLSGNETAQAISWADVPNNNMCGHIEFTSAPQIGYAEALEFYAFAYQEVGSASSAVLDFANMNVVNITVFDNATGAVSADDIREALGYAYDNGTDSKVTANIYSNTDVTNAANDVLTLWQPFYSGDTKVKNLFSALQSMYENYNLNNTSVPSSYITSVNSALNAMTIATPNNSSMSGEMLNKWQYWDDGVQGMGERVGMYVVGHTNGRTNLLGGTVTQGYPYFTVGCTQLNVENPGFTYDPAPSVSKNDIHKTVASIVGKDDEYLYVCIAPLSIEANGSVVTQRLCGFTKVHYRYTGTGSMTLTVLDERGSLLDGAEFDLSRIDRNGNVVDTFPRQTVISSDIKSVVVTDLPYIENNDSYLIRETIPPVGYLASRLNQTFLLNPQNLNQNVTIAYSRQYVNFTLQVYDRTTKDNTVPHPVENLIFTLYDASGNVANQYDSAGVVVATYDNMATNANGRITMRVYPGEYFLRQSETADGYWLNYETEIVDENCNYIQVTLEADNSGEHLSHSLTHYEKRQTISIVTQVQDEILGNRTPAKLGGVESGYVETILGKWELYVEGTRDVILGYRDDGTAVRVNKSSGALNILQNGASAGTSYDASGQAFISANQIMYEGVVYDIPTGTYQWKLKQAPQGYVTSANRTTSVDGSWLGSFTQKNHIKKHEDIVTLTRQAISMDIYSKGYTKTTAPLSYNNTITTYVPHIYNSDSNSFTAINGANLTLKSNSRTVSATSKEQLTLTNPNIVVESNRVVPNTIYQLQNTVDIVGHNGGVIKANTILGRYLSDENGFLHIAEFGTPELINPNVSSNSYTPKFGAVSVIDIKGQGANATPLPNGEYMLSILMPADNTEVEYYFEHTPIDAPWTTGTSNQDVVKTYATTMSYCSRNTKDSQNRANVALYMAPSPVDTTPGDPYNPLYPDDTINNPDDSDDIPTAPNVDWIRIHKNDRTYRMVDSANTTVENSIIFYDTEDTVPSTFALSITDSTSNEDWDETYELFFYHEISEVMFNNETAGLGNLDRNWDYRTQIVNGQTHYFKRFGAPGSSSESHLLLTDYIVFNKTSSAYDGVTRILRNMNDADNKTLSGAVYNTAWINSQLTSLTFDGNYQIAVGVLITREKDSPISNQHVRKQEFSEELAVLQFRNRQLFTIG